MSIEFDGNTPLVSLDAVIPASLGQAPGPLPISATVWVWIPDGQAPASGQPWTVWWLGQGDTFLALEVEESSGAPRLRARMKKGTGQILTATAASTLPRDEWHCVSVVATELQAGHELHLYVDDLSGVSDSDAAGTVDPSDWGLFTLGSTQQTGATRRNGRFTLEHMAIWNATLADASGPTPSDNARMFTGRIPPKDAGTEGLGVGQAPNFAYWYVVGHNRNGLRVSGNSADPKQGEFANDAPPASTPSGPQERPPLRKGFGATLPLWSANTPVMRYAVSQPIGVLPRRTIHPPSRLQPHFWVFNGPVSGPDGVADFRPLLAYFTDPNMSLMCNCDYDNANEVPRPYGPGNPVEQYEPVSDLSLIAKRCADAFELQDLSLGKGVGASDRYAGAVTMRAIGEGTRSHADAIKEHVLGWVGDTPDMQYSGRNVGFPLEQHPADWVFDNGAPNAVYQAYWAAWYRQEGVRLNAIYMERFWKALRDELDDRGLCYPLRAHFDYEGWVRDTTQLRYVNPDDPMSMTDRVQVGAWPLIEADDRFDSEALVYELGSTGGAVHKTLDDLGMPEYDPDEDFYANPENRDFAIWWWSYQYPMRMQAVAEGLFADMATYLPETTWGNYEGFVADNPEYRFLDTQDDRAWNSAPRAITPADYSTPQLYSGQILPKLRGDLAGRLGYTLSEAIRDWHNSQMDACASSRAAKPLVPTFENAGRVIVENSEPIYAVTQEDMRAQYEHGWRRGANESVLFTFATLPSAGGGFDVDFDIMVGVMDVALWLRDYVHTVPQNAQARTGRTSRIARRTL